MGIIKKNTKFFEKILEKVCTNKNNAYLCIRNQEISPVRAEDDESETWTKKGLWKKLQKVLEKFGG